MVCKAFALVFARVMLARVSSASLVQANQRGWSFQWSMRRLWTPTLPLLERLASALGLTLGLTLTVSFAPAGRRSA